MSSTITALTSGGGLAMAGDTSGQLELKTNNGTTAVTISTGQVATFAADSVINGVTVGHGGGNVAHNVVVGSVTIPSGATGDYNNAVGWNTLHGLTSGNSNNAFGNAALYSNSTGSQNTAIGDSALFANTTAYYNTAVGQQCLNNVTIGIKNTGIGVSAGTGISTGSNNTVIGYDASVTSSAADNQIILGSGLTSAGDNYFSFGKAGNVVYNQFTSNASWTRSSDERLKKDIQDDSLGLDFVCKLRPVTYKWKPSNEVPQELTRHYSKENQMDLNLVMNGFIAQEVKQALDECGNPVFGGWGELDDGSQNISREMFIMPLINAIKELNAKVDAQALEIQALKGVA